MNEMDVRINGNKMNIPQDVNTISKLIAHLNISNPVIIVEHNAQILQKEDHATTEVAPNDNIELIQFVGGG